MVNVFRSVKLPRIFFKPLALGGDSFATKKLRLYPQQTSFIWLVIDIYRYLQFHTPF